MAKYWVDYACGHQRKVQLTGPQESRDRWLEKQKSQMCWDCLKLQTETRELEFAGKIEAANPQLPQLEGTEAQVAWARRIRAKAVGTLATVAGMELAKDQKFYGDKPDPVATEEVAKFAQRILRQTKASYWIAHREDFSDPIRARGYIQRRLREEEALAAGSAAIGVCSAS